MVTILLLLASFLFIDLLMESVNVFDYSDPKEYLLNVFQAKQKKNPRFSLRAWSKQIGLRHHAMLSMIFNDKRRLKPAIATRIRNTLELKTEEARYFDMTVLYQNAGTDEERDFYANILETITPQKSFSELKIDVFRLISDWHHIAIIEMINLKDFKSDPQWIALRLGDNVKETEVKQAIKRLIRLGLIKNENGKLVVSDEKRVTTGDIPCDAVKSFHSQCLEKARQAIYNQDVNERNFQSYTMSINKSKMEDAKKLMREFELRIAGLMESESGDEVYQFNMQLFRLTENGGSNESM